MKLAAALAVLAIAGCARPKLEAPTTTAEPGIYRGTDGERIDEAALFVELAKARVVLVAESHDSAQDHAVQLRVLEAVAARRPTGLGMEMFQRPFQPALDLFVAGELDEAEMLAQTEWAGRWGFETELYRPLWSFAHDRGIPIIALNARRELTKRIAKVGIAGLAEAESADLPELDLSDQRYRAWLGEVFRSHGADMTREALDRFFAAQVMWDETMADTAARWAASHPESTLVVVVGRGHVERDWGIPSRLRRRLGTLHGDGSVISVVPVDKDAAPRWPWAQRNRFADYVWVHD